MRNVQRNSLESVRSKFSRQMFGMSLRLRTRLLTFQIDEGELVQSRIVSATSLKEALRGSPRLSLSTLVSLENATGGCLYLKFVPVRSGKPGYSLKFEDASHANLALVLASFFRPLLQGAKPATFARRSGLSVTTIKNMQNETHLPKLYTVFKMARALGFETYIASINNHVHKL